MTEEMHELLERMEERTTEEISLRKSMMPSDTRGEVTADAIRESAPEPEARCGNSNHGWKARMTCVLPVGHTGNHEDSTHCWWRMP